MSRTKLLTLVILVCSSVILGEDDVPKKVIQEFGVPYYSFEVFASPTEDREKVHLDIYIKMPFDALQFIKSNNYFVARYEIMILLFDDKEAQVDSKIWQDEIRTADFALTNSTTEHERIHTSFILDPSEYKLNIGIMDLDSRKTGHRKKTIPLSGFYDADIIMGDLEIIEEIDTTSDGDIQYFPAVKKAISDTKPNFYFRYTVLSDGGKASLRWNIKNQQEHIVLDSIVTVQLPAGLYTGITCINKEKLSFSPYILTVELKLKDNSASKSFPFQLKWIGMSNLISNLDEAILQLKYITDTNDLRSMQKADKDQKKQLFLKFWEKMDPTPDTQINELMNEYYHRIQYANEHFSGFSDGWETDMGMVFIIFGPPSDIERHPFDINHKPYEIWYYYQLNRSFVFVDQSGFGEYRLITPLYDTQYRY